jgi:hypothetical protein
MKIIRNGRDDQGVRLALVGAFTGRRAGVTEEEYQAEA